MKILDFFKRKEVVINKIVYKNTLPKAEPKPKEPEGKVRGFDAGAGGAFLDNWVAPTTTINGLLRTYITTMRARCRERARNDDYGKGFLKMSVSNIVGSSGIRLQSMAMNKDGTRDDLAIDAVEGAWKKWAKYADNVDVAGKNNWKHILDAFVRVFETDGELIIRHIEGKDAGSFGYSVQLLDSALLDETLSTFLDNGNFIELGIEYNKYGKPLAYYFIANESREAKQYPNSSNRHLRVVAKDIIHAFETEFANQGRGIPPMAVSLDRLKMISDWEDAALINAQIGAAKAGFYTTEGKEDLTTGANSIEDDGELIDEIVPGQWTKLPPGVGIETFEGDYPDGDTGPFKKAMLRAVATGLGVDYPTLGNDLESVNLSSARVAINETREQYKSQQQFFIDKIVTPIYERWLAQALVRKKITVKGYPLSIMNIDKFKEVAWLPRRWMYADPAKDTKSNLDLMNARVKSLSTVASELGYDFETEAQTAIRDEKLLKHLGLVRIDQLPDKAEPEDTEEVDDPIADSEK